MNISIPEISTCHRRLSVLLTYIGLFGSDIE